MDHYLKPTAGPVIPALEKLEVVYAANQPEYQPLRALKAPDGRVFTRWHLTDEQRAEIANGADIFLQVLTFNQPLQPVSLIVASEIDPASVVDCFEMDIPIELLEKLGG